MTDTTPEPTPEPPPQFVRRGRIYSRLLQIGGVILVALLVTFGAVALLQSQRVDNLRAGAAANRAAAEKAAATAATEYSELSSQYSNLFAACQRSTECLAHAPAQEAPVIIQGTPGTPGQSVTPEQITAALAAYCDAHDQCQGQPGVNGQNGVDGSPGATGATGATGAQGDPGQPPTSWTYTDTLGFQHTCSRSDPFDATAPTYTCN